MWKSGSHKQVLFVFFVLLVIFVSPARAPAQETGQTFVATPLSPESTYDLTVKKPMQGTKSIGAQQQGLTSVIVKLKGESLSQYKGGVPGLAPTNPHVTGAAQLDLKSDASRAYVNHLAKQQATFEAMALKAIPQARVTHRYTIVVNGLAMIVPADQVEKLKNLPEVEAVYPDTLLQPDTDNSPGFLGAPTIWNQLGGQESSGEGVIVGILDTGIWPEHPSFSDPDPSGKPYNPPPSGSRACEFSGGANPGAAFTCNNKLIGAQRFMATYDGIYALDPGEFTSARDDDGHGTHTSSTSAGNAAVPASIYSVSRGPVSGIAPRAHVIMYKVCGLNGCYSSDSAAAIQKAITDGVNVINFSISGGNSPYSDAAELAFLDAYNAGVFVATSAGNAGPSPDTTNHRGPWVATVAATTQNRAFETTATVTGGTGVLTLTGASITGGIGSAGIVVPTDTYCENPFGAGTVAGKVVVCMRGGAPGRAQKGYNVLQGGAAGMILYNQSTSVTDLETDNHFLPTIHIQYADGQALVTYVTTYPSATVSWPAGSKVTSQGDVMASFSSRGGPGQSIGVSKPDIAAPGVQILAGNSPEHVEVAGGPQGELFQAIAGTSMSSPHIAGAAALLKDLHPSWTPGKIKSALMLTAFSDVVKEDGMTAATPFDQGSGRVDLTKAGTVGFTMDETGANYVARQNDLWNANYPSIYIPVMPGIVTVQRTLISELTKNISYKTLVESPADVVVTVPKKVKVPKGGSATFSITINGERVPMGQARHATLKLIYKDQVYRIPISFVRGEPDVAIDKVCDPATIPQKGSTNCTITMTNNAFEDANVAMNDTLPKTLKLVKGSVVGGTEGKKGVSFSGSLIAAEPPDVSIGTGTSPAGYLPLSLFSIAPIAGVGDETITNFNVPAFTYAGENYTRVGVVSNGYVVVGGGTGADVRFVNQDLPNTEQPNNVLAPFWTDLNPGAAGAVRIGTLTDGSDTWIVVDWEAVKEFSTAAVNSFQVWIGINGDTHPGEDITFTYGTIGGTGDLGLLTVGAENRFGSRGGNYYFNGTGTLPTSTTQLRVTSIPGVTGGTQAVTYLATGKKVGEWVNCAEMSGDIFFGFNASCFTGNTTAP